MGGVFAVVALFVFATVFLPPEAMGEMRTGIGVWIVGMPLGLLDAIRWLRRSGR